MTEIINQEIVDYDTLYKYILFCLEKAGAVNNRHVTLEKLTKSGNLYFYYHEGKSPRRIRCYLNLRTCYYNAYYPMFRRYIHHDILKGIPNYFDFANNNEQGFASVPKGILKIPSKL